MDLDLTDDQASVAQLFDAFFERESTPTVVRANEALGFAPELWARLRETGGLSMSLGEAAGGGGAGLFEATLAAEAAGHHLAPVPFVEHVVTSRLLERVGAAVALGEAVDALVPVTLALRPAVSDAAKLVPAGAVAPTFVARSRDRLLLVRGDVPDCPVPNGAGLAVADRAVVNGAVLAEGAEVKTLHDRAVDEWRLLTAAMLVGLGDAALDLGVAYVTERHQFGVPIGSFQAIQHGLAELPGPLSGARLLVRRAAWRVDQGDDRLPVDASMAFLFATDLARTLAGRAMHYHGGYGVMEEYDIQLHYRRARGWPAQLADPAVEAEHLATLLYGEPSGEEGR